MTEKIAQKKASNEKIKKFIAVGLMGVFISGAGWYGGNKINNSIDLNNAVEVMIEGSKNLDSTRSVFDKLVKNEKLSQEDVKYLEVMSTGYHIYQLYGLNPKNDPKEKYNEMLDVAFAITDQGNLESLSQDELERFKTIMYKELEAKKTHNDKMIEIVETLKDGKPLSLKQSYYLEKSIEQDEKASVLKTLFKDDLIPNNNSHKNSETKLTPVQISALAGGLGK